VFFSTLPKLYGGRGFYYKTVREGTLPDYTAEALGEWVPNSTAAGGFFTTRLYERERALFTRVRGGGTPPRGVGLRILCGGEKMARGFCPPTHSLTTRLHGGEAKQQTPPMPAARRFLLHTLYKSRDPLIA